MVDVHFSTTENRVVFYASKSELKWPRSERGQFSILKSQNMQFNCNFLSYGEVEVIFPRFPVPYIETAYKILVYLLTFRD